MAQATNSATFATTSASVTVGRISAASLRTASSSSVSRRRAAFSSNSARKPRAIERYRQERQDPLLARAAALFSRLTLDRYTEFRIDDDAATPRLLGVRDGGQRAIEVEAMSDGTADQLFLALRLAAAEQSVAAGVRLPFLADDLFINSDDDRAHAGFEVLAELARMTQGLFFTHHAHLAQIAREVVGADPIQSAPSYNSGVKAPLISGRGA